ncbi:MAG TPA: potassium transporter TrkG [Oscillospiraceae bacterium]|nr:potassium transporter TrkG [Oscillospiraceae bacterium]
MRIWERLRLRGRLNAGRVIVGGFAALILLGTLLLLLPCATRSGESAGLLTALFTSTSASCVTGLVLVDTWTYWSAFGQAVILALIQVGGLGFMTMLVLFSMLVHRQIGMRERMILGESFNLDAAGGMVQFARRVLRVTLVMEGAAAVILSVRFIPQFGFLGGVWHGVFHAVSAFCNAGFDLMGSFGPFSSLMPYQDDPVVCVTVMVLVVVGGIGFFVWDDVLRKRGFRGLERYSRMVIRGTAVLLVVGTVFFFLIEYRNPATLGSMGAGRSLLHAAFQSVTARTAGFNTLDQAGLYEGSRVVTVILMIIGGAGGSTAGGVKVGTVAVILLAIRSNVRGEEQVRLGTRSVPPRKVMQAMTLVAAALLLFVAGSLAISLGEGVPFVDAAFETASALGTVGLTTGITPSLSAFSKLLLIVYMYLGRVGVMSFSVAMMTRRAVQPNVKYPECRVIIG